MSKPKRPRRLRTPKELFSQLREQVHLIQTFCKLFDAGDHLAAKPLSTHLRVLFDHPERPQSGRGSLLVQLGLRNGSWLDSTRPVGQNVPWKALNFPPLMYLRLGGENSGFVPKLTGPGEMFRRTPFKEWWETPIFHHHAFGDVTRRDLVKDMAETDGGAHVDGNVPESYLALLSGENYDFKVNDVEVSAENAAHACVRTIAHEALVTIHRIDPKAFAKPYEWAYPAGGTDLQSLPLA